MLHIYNQIWQIYFVIYIHICMYSIYPVMYDYTYVCVCVYINI